MQFQKVALVHDWLVTAGGAEKVLWQLHLLFPNAPIYTLVYDPACGGGMFGGCDVRTTHLQKLPFSTRLYKNLLSLMPKAWEALDLMEYDLVISSCSSCCKGIITRPDAIHMCYCHTPTRYVWDFYYAYLQNTGLVQRLAMPGMIHRMRMWDYQAAQRVDYFISNSNYIGRRIEKYYRREATTIYPPVHINELNVLELPGDYYLVVSRFVHYKRIDLAIEACNRLGKTLVIVGGGDEEKKLRALAGPTIRFTGRISDEEVMQYYSGARAFIFPGEEDFGITPVEAQSAGCPVLAYGRGGALETVQEGKTGLFFHEQTVDALAACIETFEQKGVACSRGEIRGNSLRFDEKRFRSQIEGLLRNYVEKGRKGNKVSD